MSAKTSSVGSLPATAPHHAPAWAGDGLIILGLTALAAALRLFKLGQVPPGFQFDEAYNAIEVAGVLSGQRPLFLPANGGREVVYTYLQAGLASILGLNLYTLRLTSALIGILSIPAAYLLLRIMLRYHSRRVAGFTALAMAVSFWHLHFSHYGIRVIMMPLVFSAVCGCFWLAERRGSAWLYILSGALAGFSVWVNPTGRLIPFVLGGYLLWRLWAGRAGPGISATQAGEARRRLLMGGLLAAVAALVAFLPLGLEFYRHPDFFFGHASKVSVFALTSQNYTVPGAVLRHILAVLGMFNLAGDQAWIHNLAGRPVFDLLMGLTWLLGLWLWLRRLLRRNDPDRDALIMLALWSMVMLLPSVFSDMPPNFSRTLPALPAVFVAAGLGLDALAGLRLPAAVTVAKLPRLRAAAGPLLAALIILTSAGLAVRDYFYVFPAQQGAYYNYDVDKLDAWARIQELAPGNMIYVSQLWGEHATIDFLRRQDPRVKSLDTTDTTVLPPPGMGALYVFPAEQQDRATALAALWPHARHESLADRYGAPLIDIVSVSAGDAAGWPPSLQPERDLALSFAGGPILRGMRPNGSAVYLYWQAAAPIPASYTTYVHLLDANRNRVAQVDKLPGNGSYPTNAWTPGERVIEQYHFGGPLCTGDAPYLALAGWYDLAQGSRPLPLDGGGSAAAAGELLLPAVSFAAELVRPEPMKEAPPGDLDVLRYELEGGEELQAGAPLSLDVYWRRGQNADTASYPITITLTPSKEGGAGGSVLWQGLAAPAGAQWQPGGVLCRHFNLSVPVDAGAGPYQMVVQAGGRERVRLDLQLASAARRFDAPAPAHSVNALLGENIRLAGDDVAGPAQAGQPLEVTLTWQALGREPRAYAVFVHLLDDEGKIVSQSDAAPAGDYETNRWASGEYVQDRHVLNIPAVTSPGRYYLVAGMYDPLTGARVRATGSDGQGLAGNAVQLQDVEIR